jgi:hypothetical protein
MLTVFDSFLLEITQFLSTKLKVITMSGIYISYIGMFVEFLEDIPGHG